MPAQLEASAFLDGARPFVAFWRISLPLALPGIGVAALAVLMSLPVVVLFPELPLQLRDRLPFGVVTGG